MISISVIPLVIWIIVGIIDIVNYTNKCNCSWFDYWILYGVFIINLINDTIEELI